MGGVLEGVEGDDHAPATQEVHLVLDVGVTVAILVDVLGNEGKCDVR